MGSSPAELLARRRWIESQIADEERRLVEIVELLDCGTPFHEWPAGAREALRAGLAEEPNAIEAAKARALARHLFRDEPHPLPPPQAAELAPADQRFAERVRADLMGLVRLGAGLRCIEVKR